MQEIMEHFGVGILELIAVIGTVAILFTGITDAEGNRGIPAMIGARLEIESVDYNTYTDFRETYQIESG